MQSHPDRFVLDLQVEGFVAQVGCQITLDIVQQIVHFAAKAGFNERRCKVRDGCGIAAALGDQSFSHVTDRIKIEMRKRTHQAVGPVVGR